MPLEHSSSAAALRDNMRTLHSEIGRSPHIQSRAQAIAIGLETQRRARASGHANGGIAGYQIGGGVAPGAGMITGAPMPMAPGVGSPMQMPMGMGMPPPQMMPPGVASPMMNPMVRPMMRAAGGFNIAKAPNLSPPNYFERGEARDMMHGAVPGIMPGRADTHYTKVPSGSYVLPASHLSAMGQGNSAAGLKMAQSLFGLNGPYGIGAMKMPRGPGAPKPPRFGGFSGQLGVALGGALSIGGGRGTYDNHSPVDVALSSHEYVIHPIVVRNLGKGSLEDGHRILDAYVLHGRKHEIKTLRNLPPPAKK